MGIPHLWASVGSRAINHRSAPINAVVSHRGPRRAPGRNSRNRRESTRPSARWEGRGRGQCHVRGDLLSGPQERAWPGDLSALRNLSPGSAQPGLPPDALCWCLPGMVQCWRCREEAASVGHDVNPILTHTSAPSTSGLAEPSDQDHGPTSGRVQALSKPLRPAPWFLKMRTQRLCEAVTFPVEHGGRHCARERSGGRSSLHAVASPLPFSPA